jgi:pimeloyl-ACP methyl ester carboxylesterase
VSSTPPPVGLGLAQSVVLRASVRPLFGLHHRPGGPQRRRVAFLLCQPLGYEALCSYRAFRLIAEQLCGAGFHVLRFDYTGTGNSADDALGGASLGEDIDAAIESLKATAGVEQVCLLGLRAGALLAAEASCRRDDICGLALLATPMTGKTLVRELRAFQAMFDGSAPADQGGLRVAGFSVAPPAVAELQAIDTAKLRFPPGLPMLLLRREDLSAEVRLAQRCTTEGQRVTSEVLPEYGALLSAAETTVVSDVLLARVRGWADLTFPEWLPLEPVDPDEPEKVAVLESDGVCERGLRFGTGGRMFGIFTEPASGIARSPRMLGVVLLNTGANHHVGAARLNVHLARRLAAQGHVCLRFDLSGLGESRAMPGQPENELYAKDIVADAQEALQALRQSHGVEQLMLVGVCSGAFLGFRVALLEPRVVGQVLVNLGVFEHPNPAAFEVRMKTTFKSSRAYLDAVLELRTWRRLLRGDVAALPVLRHVMRNAAQRARASVETQLRRITGKTEEIPPVERDFRRLCERGTRTLLVYSGNDAALDHLATQLGPEAETLAHYPTFRLHIYDAADHTFTRLDVQRELEDEIAAFAAQL